MSSCETVKRRTGSGLDARITAVITRIQYSINVKHHGLILQKRIHFVPMEVYMKRSMDAIITIDGYRSMRLKIRICGEFRR